MYMFHTVNVRDVHKYTCRHAHTLFYLFIRQKLFDGTCLSKLTDWQRPEENERRWKKTYGEAVERPEEMTQSSRGTLILRLLKTKAGSIIGYLVLILKLTDNPQNVSFHKFTHLYSFYRIT